MTTERGPQEIPEHDAVPNMRQAIRYYLIMLRTSHPSTMKKTRIEYERVLNDVIEHSDDPWRIIVDDEADREEFHTKFHFDINEAHIAGVGYSRIEESTVVMFRHNVNGSDWFHKLPIDHVPHEYRLLTEEEFIAEG